MLLVGLGVDQLRAALQQYGYGAVAAGVLLENLGVPVPGDAMLLAAAAFAQQGELRLPIVLVTGAVAAMVGDNIGFEIGRKLGRPWLTRHFPRIFTPTRVEKTDAFFHRRGALAVFLARFIPGIRVVAAITAGTSSFSRRTFILANALGAFAWSAWNCFLGYSGVALGRKLLPVLHHVHRTTWVIAAITLTLAVIIVTLRWHRHRGSAPAP
jgi:membrane protein DedA with SNARE-associated domain